LLPATECGPQRHQRAGACPGWAVGRCGPANANRAAQRDRAGAGARGAWTMTTQHLTLEEANALDHDAFMAALGGLFEGPPWIVAEAWQTRPFASVEQLHRALCNVMEAAPIERQEALIRAHPDLVGRAALAGTLSPASTTEQATAGLDHLTPNEI